MWGLGTPRTLRVYWALHELGLDYEIEPIATRTAAMERDDFLAVSPGMKIPALTHGEIRLVESAAITRYLFDTFASDVLTSGERAQMNRWIYFALMEIDATALYVIRRHEGLTHIYGEAPAAVQGAYDYADRQMQVLETAFDSSTPYLLGDRFCEADIHVGTCLAWADLLDIKLPAKLNDYFQRLQARPAYRAAQTANSPE